MPCFDSRDADDRHVTKDRLDEATRCLCTVLAMLEAERGPLRQDMFPQHGARIVAWWAAHKAEDAARRARTPKR